MKFPEHYRSPHPMGFKQKTGDQFGFFRIPSCKNSNHIMYVQANDGSETGWDHVSVSLVNRCPSWEEMCQIKNLFWDEDECVVQFHPPKSEYVNNAIYCLHLWKNTKEEIKMPPSILVGIK